jgi:hypothetical protein
MKLIPLHIRKILLGDGTSRVNKLHIAIGWQQGRKEPYYLEWKFKGDFLASRLEFKFEPEGKFVEAKSFEEDVHFKMKDRISKDI